MILNYHFRSTVLDAALLLGAPDAVAVVDDILGVPVLLDLQQARVIVSKVPKGVFNGANRQ